MPEEEAMVTELRRVRQRFVKENKEESLDAVVRGTSGHTLLLGRREFSREKQGREMSYT